MPKRSGAKRLAAALLPILMLLPLASCAAEASAVVYAMDTVSQIKICAESAGAAGELVSKAEAAIYRFDGIFSAENGDIARLNAGSVSSLSGYACETAAKALYVKELSGGAFSPELGALTSLWDVSGKVGEISEPPEAEDIEKALSLPGEATAADGELKISGEISLDLGGVAKGAACEYVAGEMKAAGASGGIIDLGGNVGVFGKKPDGSDVYRVALTSAEEAFAYISLSDAFVSVASSELRYFTDGEGNRYHHILDPRTGYPAESEFYAVAVICRDGAYADALSTAIFIVGWDAALVMRDRCDKDFDIVALTKAGEVKYTEDSKVIIGAVTAAPNK